MYAAYLFSVVLGGGLLLLSLLGGLLGGDAVELELEAEIDIDFDADTEVDYSASKILSIRTLTYTLFGFGAVGWLLSRGGLAPEAASTITYAAIGGMISGTLVNRAFGYLRGTETGMIERDDSFVGLAGEVTLRLGDGSSGSVAVEQGGRGGTPSAPCRTRACKQARRQTSGSVVVVEMKDGVAYVAPSDDDLTALP